jgi:hypothetical protein
MRWTTEVPTCFKHSPVPFANDVQLQLQKHDTHYSAWRPVSRVSLIKIWRLDMDMFLFAFPGKEQIRHQQCSLTCDCEGPPPRLFLWLILHRRPLLQDDDLDDHWRDTGRRECWDRNRPRWTELVTECYDDDDHHYLKDIQAVFYEQISWLSRLRLFVIVLIPSLRTSSTLSAHSLYSSDLT